MKAEVTERFYGVRDGAHNPEWHEVGQVIEGDLARVAVEQCWAKMVDAPANKALGGAPVNKFRNKNVAGDNGGRRGKRAKPTKE